MHICNCSKEVVNVQITNGVKTDTVNIHRGRHELPPGYYLTDFSKSRFPKLRTETQGGARNPQVQAVQEPSQSPDPVSVQTPVEPSFKTSESKNAKVDVKIKNKISKNR